MKPKVESGQLWLDNDPRSVRTLRVDYVSSGYAHCVCLETKRRTRIKEERFGNGRKDGYTLIEKVEFEVEDGKH